MASRFSMEAVLSLTDNMTGNFKKAANQTTAISRSTQQQITAMNTGVNRMLRAGAIATVAAVGAATVAITKMTNQTATLGDELAKTGRQIGWTAEGIQEMQFAADRQGVSADTLVDSLKKLNKNVGDLRANTGALKTILNQTNPALAEQLMNVESNEEAFNLLVNEIGSLPNQMDKAALAQAAFGRAGQDMLKLIEAGPAGIAALRSEAREYGLITNESAAASEAYVDAMTNLKAVWAGAKTELASGLIPRSTELLTKLKEFLIANREIISQNINKFLDGMSNAFKKAVPFLNATWGIIKALVSAFVKLKPAIEFAVIWFGAYIALTKAFMAFQVARAVFIAVRAFMAMAKAQGILNAVMAANPLMLIVIAIAAVVAAVIWMVKNWDKVKNVLIVIWGAIKKAGIAVWDGIKIAFKASIDFMQKVFFTFADYLITIYASIFKGIMKAAAAVGSFLGADVSGITNMIDKVEGLQASVREKSFIGDIQENNSVNNGSSVAQQQAISERDRRVEESRMRNDIYLHAPVGAGISETPGGVPSQAVNMGVQQ